MNNKCFFVTSLLVLALSACSSGSSNEPETTGSPNTVPTTDNTTDAGTPTGPSEDPSTTNGDTVAVVIENGSDTTNGADTDTDGAADTSGNNEAEGTTETGTDDNGDTADSTGGNDEGDSTSDTTGGNDSDGGTTDGADDSGDTDGESDSAGSSDTDGGGDTDSGNDTDGGGDTDSGNDTDSGGDTDGGGDTTTGEDSNDTDGNTAGETSDPDPVINPDSALGQMQLRINTLAGRSLLALNRSISQGEMLSAQQEQCLGTFDPGMGEPLLSIDCDQPLGTGDVAIFTSIAALKDTAECRASLQNGNADACVADKAEIRVDPITTVPEMGRPQIQAGAMLSYNIEQDRFKLENLTSALSGTFVCEYDLTNGNALGSNQTGNCDEQLARISNLIDQHLAIEN